MDNNKTGALIKELRKEKNMTQKDLADLLHITDRAVSKWERGLCAPDISLLEPLSKALDISITELISGERVTQNEISEKIEESAKNVIDYSKNEIAYKIKLFKKKYLAATIIGIAVVSSICLFCLWWSGYFNIIGKSVSPNGTCTITVYDRDVFNFSNAPTVATRVLRAPNIENRIVYSNWNYNGIWWSPDSTNYIIAMDNDTTTQFVLNDLETNSKSDLNILLSSGVAVSELAKSGLQFDTENNQIEIDYQFLQWSDDSSAMLFYYSFIDIEQEAHAGYFWYKLSGADIFSSFPLEPISK